MKLFVCDKFYEWIVDIKDAKSDDFNLYCEFFQKRIISLHIIDICHLRWNLAWVVETLAFLLAFGKKTLEKAKIQGAFDVFEKKEVFQPY